MLRRTSYRPKCPAGEPAASQQVVEGRRGRPLMINGKSVAEGENSMHNLPGGMVGGVEPPAVAGVGKHRIDPFTEASHVDEVPRRLAEGRGGRLAVAACGRQKAGDHARGGTPAEHNGKGQRTKSGANHSGAKSVKIDWPERPEGRRMAPARGLPARMASETLAVQRGFPHA